MSESKTAVEKQTALIIQYRKLKINNIVKEGDKTTYFLSRGDSNHVFLCVVGQRTIGISYVRELRDLVEKTWAEKDAIVKDGKYTWLRPTPLKWGLNSYPQPYPHSTSSSTNWSPPLRF